MEGSGEECGYCLFHSISLLLKVNKLAGTDMVHSFCIPADKEEQK
jgi:hypothetical protein